MNKEYQDNQKKQKKTFKKMRKYIGRIFLWAGIGIASAAFFPGGAIMELLKGTLGELLARSVAFFGQWGIAATGLVGAIINGIKAHNAAETIDDSQEEEENIVDCLVRDKGKLERKVEDLSKKKELENDKSKEEVEIELTKESQQNTATNKPKFTVLKGGKKDTKDDDKQLKKAA